MNYKLYKLTFSTSVHFGKGRLGTTENRFLADTLFSAICTEAVKSIGFSEIDFFYESAKRGELLLSDSMPFIGGTLYIPKPIMSLERSSEEYDSKIRKEYKKLSFIPFDRIHDYFKGNFDAVAENKKLSQLGEFSEKTAAAIFDNDDALPYNIGIFSFSPDCGLYFIMGFENDEVDCRFDAMIYSLGYTGIGGKISSGLGKFRADSCKIPDDMLVMLNENSDEALYITLSLCMASEESEISKAISDADYSIIKRSGFVGSVSYSDTFRKRKELYCFSGGSCFKNKFLGDVFDLSDGGSHPVYRYAKPMFMGVKI